MQDAFKGREQLLLELIRSLLALSGRAVEARMEIPGGREVLVLEGVLTTPFRQPLDSRVITLGFQLDAQRLDLHLEHVADVNRWPAAPADARDDAPGVRLSFEDGASLELRARACPEPEHPP
jgi:hypothetical protein